jgi:hypothetical protein
MLIKAYGITKDSKVSDTAVISINGAERAARIIRVQEVQHIVTGPVGSKQAPVTKYFRHFTVFHKDCGEQTFGVEI